MCVCGRPMILIGLRSRYNTAGWCVCLTVGDKWIKGPRAVQGKRLATHSKRCLLGQMERFIRDYNVMRRHKRFPPQKLPEWNLRSLI